jgi:hypothetical protein
MDHTSTSNMGTTLGSHESSGKMDQLAANNFAQVPFKQPSIEPTRDSERLLGYAENFYKLFSFGIDNSHSAPSSSIWDQVREIAACHKKRIE